MLGGKKPLKVLVKTAGDDGFKRGCMTIIQELWEWATSEATGTAFEGPSALDSPHWPCVLENGMGPRRP